MLAIPQDCVKQVQVHLDSNIQPRPCAIQPSVALHQEWFGDAESGSAPAKAQWEEGLAPQQP